MKENKKVTGNQRSNKVSLGRRKFVSYLLSSATLFGFATFFWRDSYHFKLNHQTFHLKALQKPLKMVHLSDFHYGKFIKESDLEKWIDAVIREKPELVLITGDMIDSSTTELDGLIRQLSKLAPPLGVWGVWGNHDYNSHGKMQNILLTGLNNMGINILVNEGVLIRDDIFLVGTDDLYNGNPDIALATKNKPVGTACLHMTHNPDYLFSIPKTIDFSFCGHTHGGQVRLPIIGAPYLPSAYGDKFIGGYVDSPVKAFVSKGLGFTGLPIRFNARAEIVVLDLLPS